MRIAVDIQHLGKRSSPNDRGAAFNGLTEVCHTLAYGRELAVRLHDAGHTVFWSPESLRDGVLDGDYSERHRWANERSIDLYIACHVNAADNPPAQAVVLIDHRTGRWARDLAKRICGEWRASLPVSAAVVRELTPSVRGWSCISGVNAPTLLLEPGFINHPEFAAFLLTLDGPGLIAAGVVNAINGAA